MWSQIVPQSQIEASHKSCRHTTPSDVSPSATCAASEEVTDVLYAPLPEPEDARFCARARRSSPARYGVDLLAPPAGPCRLGLALAALAAYSLVGSPHRTSVPLSCFTTVRRALLCCETFALGLAG